MPGMPGNFGRNVCWCCSTIDNAARRPPAAHAAPPAGDRLTELPRPEERVPALPMPPERAPTQAGAAMDLRAPAVGGVEQLGSRFRFQSIGSRPQQSRYSFADHCYPLVHPLRPL
jgi:hypothetical protein